MPLRRLSSSQSSLVAAALRLASERWAEIAAEGAAEAPSVAAVLAKQAEDAEELRAIFAEAERVEVDTGAEELAEA